MAVTRINQISSLKLIINIVTRILRDLDRTSEQSNIYEFIDNNYCNEFSIRYLTMFAESEYNLRRNRNKLFSTNIFSDPAWDIILDLFIRESRGRETTITSCCIASHVPPTTALRYIDTLMKNNIIKIVDNKSDKRSRLVELTENGRATMKEHLLARVRFFDQQSNLMLTSPETRKDLMLP